MNTFQASMIILILGIAFGIYALLIQELTKQLELLTTTLQQRQSVRFCLLSE